MSEDWKKHDRPCSPCANCGAELYEKFWGNGGWAKTDRATEEPHSARDCIIALRAELARVRAELAEAHTSANRVVGQLAEDAASHGRELGAAHARISELEKERPTWVNLGHDRDILGRVVRDVWIEWCRQKVAAGIEVKESNLLPWEEMPELDREVDRLIGETLFRAGIAFVADSFEQKALASPPPQQPPVFTATGRDDGKFSIHDPEPPQQPAPVADDDYDRIAKEHVADVVSTRLPPEDVASNIAEDMRRVAKSAPVAGERKTKRQPCPYGCGSDIHSYICDAMPNATPSTPTEAKQDGDDEVCWRCGLEIDPMYGVCRDANCEARWKEMRTRQGLPVSQPDPHPPPTEKGEGAPERVRVLIDKDDGSLAGVGTNRYSKPGSGFRLVDYVRADIADAAVEKARQEGRDEVRREWQDAVLASGDHDARRQGKGQRQ